MSGTEQLLITVQMGVATLTLNRLKQRNALDTALIKSLQTALNSFADDSSIRVLTLAANGPFFCAGGDLQGFKNASLLSERENYIDAAALALLLRSLSEFPKPTLALVQGPAFGGGVGLLACCDVVIAAQSALFALSEVKLGLVPATIAPYLLRALGARQMRRYALTAESFTAEEAYRIGLVHRVVSDEKLNESANSLTTQLRNNGPTALTTTKQLINDLQWTRSDEMEKTAALLAQVRISTEAQEGLAAFFEKRDPEWKVPGSD